MRKRNVRIQFWLTESEYEELIKKVEESGLKRNAFLIRMIRQQTIYPADKLSDLNLKMDTLLVQIRGMATNLNQITKIANTRKEVPHIAYLEKLLNGMRNFTAAIDSATKEIAYYEEALLVLQTSKRIILKSVGNFIPIDDEVPF